MHLDGDLGGGVNHQARKDGADMRITQTSNSPSHNAYVLQHHHAPVSVCRQPPSHAWATRVCGLGHASSAYNYLGHEPTRARGACANECVRVLLRAQSLLDQLMNLRRCSPTCMRQYHACKHTNIRVHVDQYITVRIT